MWVDDLVGKTSTRLTAQDGNFTAIWSSDGHSVYFTKGVPTSNIYRRAADGSDKEERVTRSENSQFPTSTSADGAWLAYSEVSPTSATDVWVMPIPAPGTRAAGPQAIAHSKSVESDAMFW